MLTRPSVVFAIVFGCFAVLIPRVFVPLFRPRQSAPVHQQYEHFRRQSSPPTESIPRNDNDDNREHASDSFAHTRMRHPHAEHQQQSITDQVGPKSAVKFALPMYTVGIAIFFLYTCFKYWAKRNTDEHRIKSRYSSNNIQWNGQKKKFKYHVNIRQEQNEDDDDDELYAGLDPDYVEYLRSKKQKELNAEQALTREQRQMHNTLDEMKHSLSFISSKLGATQTGNSLTSNEISQLQDRLASTEAQMCKILNALDIASNQVNKLTRSTRQTLQHQVQQENTIDNDDDEGENRHLSSRSQSENEQRNVEHDEQESSSSYEEDGEDEVPIEDNESESSSSERYGLMTTNYECDPSAIVDYELDTIKKPDETTDSQTKVHEWNERHHSQSISSNSSNEQDQSIPNDEQKSNENSMLDIRNE
ncbi:unnamed protein product [Adineta ricciae]|uniref:Resistance to inhibitors of cholinesterase protein 3 N-terminal domain-containing protein n=2 Tax=Adineta ricciae TaxID=249248 RepID=A0A813WZL8_ADIRI|nr:unnamed protein product [Adineta ricciae]